MSGRRRKRDPAFKAIGALAALRAEATVVQFELASGSIPIKSALGRRRLHRWRPGCSPITSDRATSWASVSWPSFTSSLAEYWWNAIFCCARRDCHRADGDWR
jgi:hypothetical protein